MKRTLLPAAFVLVVVSASGCASSKSVTAERPRGEARPDKALVYFVRGETEYGERRWIFEGGTLLAALERNSYYFVYVEPGVHWVWTRRTTAPHGDFGRNVFLLESGRVYYLRSNDACLCAVGEAILDELSAKAVFLEPTREEIEKGHEMARDYAAAAAPSDQSGATPGSGPAIQNGARIPAGTAITLELVENATSHEVAYGQTLRFIVAQDVVVGGRVVLSRGFPVEGVVDRVERAGRQVALGFLEVEIRKLTFSDGVVVPVLGIVTSACYFIPVPTPLAILELLAVIGWWYHPSGPYPGLPGEDRWLFAGSRTTVYLRQEALVDPAAGAVNSAGAPAPSGSDIPATGLAPIVLPWYGRVSGRYVVRLAMPEAPAEIAIVAIGGAMIPTPARPEKIQAVGGQQELVFDAWKVVRFAKLVEGAPQAGTLPAPSARLPSCPALLLGLKADGSAFTATVSIAFEYWK